MAAILIVYLAPHISYDSYFDPLTVRVRNKENENAFLSGHTYLLKKSVRFGGKQVMMYEAFFQHLMAPIGHVLEYIPGFWI